MVDLLKELYKNRFLLLLWVKRELKARYAGSAFGLFWTVILPLATILIYYVFFALVLKVKIPELPSTAGYFFYLLAGLLPWMTISEAINQSANSLITQSALLKQTVFPIEILPAVPVVTSLLPQIFGTFIYILLLGWFSALKPIGLIFLPILLILQMLMTAGLGYLFAAISAIYRDFIQVLNIILQLWFYLTPILYPPSLVPARFKWILSYNPLTWLVRCYQNMFISGWVDYRDLFILAAWSLSILFVGTYVFSLLKPGITDEL